VVATVVLLGGAAGARTEKKPDAETHLARVQQRYKDVDRFEAKFTQTVTNGVSGRVTKSSGRLYLARPGKMSWDYAKPEKNRFVSDGKLLWIYEPGSKQVYKTKLDGASLPAAVTFLQGKGDLTKEFKVKVLSSDSTGHVLELVPIAASARYKRLVFTVAADYTVTTTTVVEANDNENTITYKPVAKPKFEDTIFDFKVPAGVKVIE
jgi:outer membrane lipoprotein carrier protein